MSQKIINLKQQPNGGRAITSTGGSRGLSSGDYFTSNTTQDPNSPLTPLDIDDAISYINSTTGSRYDDYSRSGSGGYEFTGAFADRTTGQSGANDIGTDVEYTQAMATNKQWLRFGFNTAQQVANDVQYWGETNTNFDQTKGLFGGLFMPSNVNSMFNFVQNNDYNAASTSGNLQYNAATGSYNMSQLKPGDFCEFRFDFNLTPQIGNVTVETGLIWRTRDGYTFELTGQPAYLGVETAQKTFLFRPIITAYLASYEDVYASALPAIRCTGPVFCQPLTTLFNVQR